MNYCPNCGTKLSTKTLDKKMIKECESCGYIDWDNWVNVACVVAAFTEENELLMVRLKGMEEGKITIPGGFRELGESLEEAAIREFYEETGMITKNLKLYKIFTKDEQRLIWVVFKGEVIKSNFIENSEVSEVLFIKNINEINMNELRGKLTEKVVREILEKKVNKLLN